METTDYKTIGTTPAMAVGLEEKQWSLAFRPARNKCTDIIRFYLEEKPNVEAQTSAIFLFR